jgi:small subunit ribosomal protein S17|tara:strand:+ start:322 stop:519 length:198 start_codon:yes stop_codon:yes gene_type:complete
MKMMKKTKRLVARHRNFMVHDEQALCQTGDTVRIKEVMKMSKHKKHTLVEILKSEHIEFQSVEPQ